MNNHEVYDAFIAAIVCILLLFGMGALGVLIGYALDELSRMIWGRPEHDR